jgi:hypothetical protein
MSTPMLPRERCDYSAIVDRPPLKLPDGARLAFWTIVNFEVWDIGRPMPRQVLPAPTGAAHWTSHQYEYVSRFEGVVHWNGEEIDDWYTSTGEQRLAAE